MIINNIEEFIEQILICYDEYKEETTNYKQIILKFKETRSFMIEELKKVICGERLNEETIETWCPKKAGKCRRHSDNDCKNCDFDKDEPRLL